MKRHLFIAASAVTAAACLMQPARSAELIALSNGFQMRCDHHSAAGASVRIYFTPGNDNYIELPPAEIASVSQVSARATPPVSNSTMEKFRSPRSADLSQYVTPSKSTQTSVSRASVSRGNLPPDSREPSAPAQPELTSADLRQMLAKAGQTHSLDVDLLASIVQAESGGDPRTVSRAGARGLMQLMPSTAAALGVQNSFQPQQNVGGGSAYLDALLTRYSGNLALALAAYNAGPEAVDHYHGIPPYPETQAYVARVIHAFNRRVLARRAAAARLLPHKLHTAVSQK